MSIQQNKNLKEHARELRNNSTLGEILLWSQGLRAKKMLGYQFNRQFIIENYIVDFVARKLKLIIEIDGYSHQFKTNKDQIRDKRLKELGYTVVRFSEKEVRQNVKAVITQLDRIIENIEGELGIS